MSGRVYRSRSSFDDPNGNDPSYRLGSVIQSIASEFKSSNMDSSVKRRRPLSSRPGNPKRRKTVGPFSSRPKSKFVSMLSKAGKGRVNRYSFANRRRPMRKVYGRRKGFALRNKSSARSNAIALALKTLIQPVMWDSESTVLLADYGNGRQNHCSWYADLPISPGAVDAILATGYGQANSTTVASDAKIFLESGKYFNQIKNTCSHRIEVECYLLYPRTSMPSSFSNLSGINPQYLQDAFSEAALNSLALSSSRTRPYNEHGSNLFQTTFPRTFKMRRVLHKFLLPGEFCVLQHTVRNKAFSKRMFGISSTAGTVSGAWDHHTKLPPIYLYRVQGAIVHDESAIPAAADGLYNQTKVSTGTDVNPQIVPGGYAASFYTKKTFYQLTPPVQNLGMLSGTASAVLPQAVGPVPGVAITAANEKTWEQRVPADDAMDI